MPVGDVLRIVVGIVPTVFVTADRLDDLVIGHTTVFSAHGGCLRHSCVNLSFLPVCYLASHIPRARADDGHAHRDVGGAHVSPARKRGKSLDVHVEQLAKGNRLGVAQLGEVPRYILDWAVTWAQLNGQRATSNVSAVAAYPSCVSASASA